MKKPFYSLSRYSLFLVILALPFSDARVEWMGIPVYVPELAVLLSALLFLISMRRKESSARTVPKTMLLGFLLVLVGMIASAYAAGTLAEPTYGAMKSWLVFPAVFGFLLTQVFRSERDIREALFIWFLVSATVATATLFPGPTGAETYDGRLHSFFLSPNHLALFLIPGSIIGWLFISGIGNIPKHFLALTLEGLIILTLFRTESHGAIAASFLGTAIYFIGALFGRRGAIRLVLGIGIIIAGLFAFLHLSGQWERLSAGDVRHSLASRVMIWNVAGSMIAEKPFFGIGPRSFQEAYLARQESFPPYLEWAVPHPHNVFLSFWLSAGLLGLSGFLLLLILLFFGAVEGLSRRGVSSRSVPATLFALGSAAVLAGLVDETYFKTDLAIGFWTILTFSIHYVSAQRKQKQKTSE